MNEDKLRTLKKALLYSYQAATAILEDKREFRCLINPDKLKNDYDNKIISIPFEDICLRREEIEEPIKGKTSENFEPIGMKPGDTFTWKENGSDWIVYLQRLEETAYFRAEIRRCRYEVEINENKYKVWVKGPEKKTLTWHNRNTKPKVSWNDIDYDLEMYITRNEETLDYFHRFQKIIINDKPWEIQAVDSISTEGIIEVALKEDFTNSIKDEVEKIKKEEEEEKIDNEEVASIDGDTEVFCYDKKHYEIKNLNSEIEGEWFLSNNKIKILNQTSLDIDLYIDLKYKNNFDLIYKNKNDDSEIAKINILVKTL